ncbi:cysteine desulfurase [Oscillospiraceae bacterium OttesenSCG-928-F05]|nr:cysteine desulfurase [Oscillospiraceae bacterium OttesenSCG-928-F05]
MHYLDNAATTRVSEKAAAAAMAAMGADFGNPSSVHNLGIAAESLMERSRSAVAAALACDPRCVFFTSGGTEANNWALFAGAEIQRRKDRHIVTSPVEHAAVLQPVKALERAGWQVDYVTPGKDGSVSPEALEAVLRPNTSLVSLMAVNNETGADSPISALAAVIRKKAPEALFHVDAVQAFLKTPLSPSAMGADMMSLSAHKIYGPKGVGALYVRKGLQLSPLIFGGGQERGLRSGTEPVPLIAAFGAAVEEGLPKLKETMGHVAALRERLLAALNRLPGADVLFSGGAITVFTNKRYPAEVMIRMLESRQVYVSGGSACARGRESHVLRVLGVPPEKRRGALRASLGRTSTAADVDALVTALGEILGQ